MMSCRDFAARVECCDGQVGGRKAFFQGIIELEVVPIDPGRMIKRLYLQIDIAFASGDGESTDKGILGAGVVTISHSLEISKDRMKYSGFQGIIVN